MWRRILLIGRVFFILALLAVMEQLSTTFVLLVGSNFFEHVHALPTRIREVVMHGVHHRAVSALAATHLRSDVDLHAVERGFSPELPVQRAS